MTLLEKAHNTFAKLCEEWQLEPSAPIEVTILDSKSLLGPDADPDLAIMQGKEHIIQSTYRGVHGQAFTPEPSEWSGTLEQALELDISNRPRRSVFVAVMNSVLRSLHSARCTEHCRSDAPVHCASEIASRMDVWFGKKRYALLGFQPLLIKSLAEQFSPRNVKALDWQHYYLGSRRNDVDVLHGIDHLPGVLEWCEVGISSGACLIYDTIDTISQQFHEARKPLIFFGTTISGTAALTGLQRICPYGH